MRRILASALILGLFSFSTLALVGCGEETKREDTTKVSSGTGTTTIQKTEKVKTTGDGGATPAPADAPK